LSKTTNHRDGGIPMFKIFKEFNNKPKMNNEVVLRKATLKDCRFVFNLRNKLMSEKIFGIVQSSITLSIRNGSRKIINTII